MGKYIHLFETQSQFEAVYNDDQAYEEPWVSYTTQEDRVDYNKSDEPTPVCDYYLIYDATQYTDSVQAGPVNAFGYDNVIKLWEPIDGDLDVSGFNPSMLPTTVSVTINNLNGQGNNVTRVWNFPAVSDWGEDKLCGFPFTAQDFNEEPLGYEAWVVATSSTDFLFGIMRQNFG